MHVLLLHNPGAGNEDHPPQELIDLLGQAGHEVTWRSVIDRRWKEALEHNPDLVAVAGGDGSARVALPTLVGTGHRVTLLPVGSANNVAVSAGFSYDDPARLIAGWETARVGAYDVMALIDGKDEHLFVEAAGGGLFTETLRRAGEETDELAAEQKLRNSLELLRTCAIDAKPQPWAVEVDGRSFEAELIALELMNARTTGPNVPLAPAADPGDSLLDVVFVGDADRKPLTAYLEQRLAGRDADPPPLETHRAASVRFHTPAGSHVHVDDDVIAQPRAAWLSARAVGQVTLLVPTGA